MSLTEQTGAVKTAIQNAFESVKNKIDKDIVDLESRTIDRTDAVVLAGMNDVVRYNPVIVENAAEVEYQKGQEESFSDVFDNWKRISHGPSNTYPYNASEITSWAYDPSGDVISCTVNSVTLVGFIGLEKFEKYNFEVLVNSTDADDDDIGICLAYTELGGREYTLTAIRNMGGMGGAGALFRIIYNYKQSDEHVLTSVAGGLSNPAGWSKVNAGVKIRAERTLNGFVVKTTDVDDPTYAPASEVSFNLDDDPRLAKFKGPQQYGYVAFSQRNSTWETLARPISLDEIVDLENGVKWDYDGNDWTSSPLPAGQTSLDPRRFYFNEATQRLYVSDESGAPIRILLPDHRDSDDHDGRYYPKAEVVTVIQDMIDASFANGHSHPWSQIQNAPDTATRWPTWSEVTTKPSDFPPAAHDHDLVYYQKSVVDGLLADKVDHVAGKELTENDFTDALLTKLNGIEAGAKATSPTDLSRTVSATDVVILSSTGSDATVPAATPSAAGVMSAGDKTKLNGIESGAEVNAATTASRSLNDTTTLLQAKAFVDHTASSDHDGRYHTKSQVTNYLAGKLDNADVLNILTSTSVSKALSAAQGKVLKDEVDSINTLLQSDTGTLDSLQEVVDFIQLNRADLDSLTIASIAGLQGALNGKVDSVAGKALSENDFTNALLTKLNGIEAGATSSSNAATNLTQSRNASSYTIVSSTGTNTTLQASTTSAAGIMSAADKSKLDGIAAGADVNVGTNLGVSGSGNARNLTSSTGGNVSLPIATGTHAGLMSTEFATKLDSLGSATVSAEGLVKLVNGVSSTSTTSAATANAVKLANDNASGRVSKVGDTMTGALSVEKSGSILELGTGDALAGADGHVAIGHPSFGWWIEYIGTTGGTTGNHLDIRSLSSNGGLRFGHDGKLSLLAGDRLDGVGIDMTGYSTIGRLAVAGSDDGVSELQVDGDTSLRGNVGVNNSDPTHALDVDGDARLRDTHAMKFGGSGANDDKFEIRYNPATESLDFNYLG